MQKLIFAIVISLMPFIVNPVLAMDDPAQDPHVTMVHKEPRWPHDTHLYGVCGIDAALSDYAAHVVKQYPLATIEEGEIPTFNKMGAIVKVPGPFAEQFIEFAGQCYFPVLSVGETGNVAWPALEKHIPFIANDLDPRHLAHLYDKTPEENLRNLYLKAGKFPDDILFPEGSLGAIYFGRMLHFMTGEEIEKSFKKAYELLKIGGKVFARASSPYQRHLQFFIPTLEERKKNGEPWPGVCTEIERGWPTVHPHLPLFSHR